MRVVIAGGGAVGTYIADELRRSNHAVVIVEIDERRVNEAVAARSSWVITASNRACFKSFPNTPATLPLDDRPVCEL